MVIIDESKLWQGKMGLTQRRNISQKPIGLCISKLCC